MRSAWRLFWTVGTWWKALLLVTAYWGVYQLLALALSSIGGSFIDTADVLSTPMSVLFGAALPILAAGVLLLLFARSMGWLHELFGPQQHRGGSWMWIAVVLVLIPILMRSIGTNWSAWSVTVAFSVFFLGLSIGFTEELATRGLVVTMLRRGGHGERTVLVLSSLFFALLHSGNIITGQAP